MKVIRGPIQCIYYEKGPNRCKGVQTNARCAKQINGNHVDVEISKESFGHPHHEMVDKAVVHWLLQVYGNKRALLPLEDSDQVGRDPLRHEVDRVLEGDGLVVVEVPLQLSLKLGESFLVV